MNYAKVENGQVIQVGLAETGTLKDGSTVSGYNLLDEGILKAEGWLPLSENKPEYNAETEYLEFVDYTVGENEVIANYTVKQKEPVIPIPTLEERLESAESAILALMEVLDNV